MSNNAVFNAAVCLIGFVILLVHIVKLFMKKNRRRDENSLFIFLVFTAFHFAAYFTFTFLKVNYASNGLIMGFYTAFYIANNLEVFFLFLYMRNYVEMREKTKRALDIINLSAFAIIVVFDIVNIFVPMFFHAENGEYVREKTMFLSQGYQFLMLGIVFIAAITHKQLQIREKAAFATYCVLPLIAIVFQNFFKGYAIAYVSIIVAIEVLFFFLNVEKNVRLEMEEEKNKDAQIRVMLSQIQPHFVYNSLSAISTLIPLEPEKAQKALDDFTDYLRLNLSSLTENHLIPFEDELRHIKTFIALEELRFPDRIKVIYDLDVTDFYLPPLSVQPLVENAIKHGILKKIEGGTVKISTYEDDDAYIVKIEDNGIGFDKDGVDFASNKHFGLNNIEYRIAKMSGGSLHVESEPNKGTTAVATFPKKGR